MGLECISLYHQSGISIAFRMMKMEKKYMTTGMNYVILISTLRIEKQMWPMFCLNVLFIILMFRLFIKAA